MFTTHIASGKLTVDFDLKKKKKKKLAAMAM